MKLLITTILLFSISAFAKISTYKVDFKVYQNDKLLSSPSVAVYPGSLAMVTQSFNEGSLNIEFVVLPNYQQKKTQGKKEVMLDFVLTFTGKDNVETKSNERFYVAEGKTGQVVHKSPGIADVRIEFSAKSIPPVTPQSLRKNKSKNK